ncbi:hypothetical protein D770_09920 [Flammeovirgaceae bacterium 311]|nr:hypothetical protein D770_09920 [Flammeovirgaceae bacterium 311]
MLKDIKIIRAVSNISQRAERQKDTDKIVSSYVEVGILQQLLNSNNQILYGRRGTGKTHILKMLESEYSNNPSITTCYIDCRFLGSSPQFTDTTLSLSHRCSSLFIDILNELVESILNHIANNPNSYSEQSLKALDDFSKASVGEIQKSKKIIQRNKDTNSDQTGFGLNIKPTSLDLSLSGQANFGNENERTEEFNTEEYSKIAFPDLHFFLRKALKFAGTDLCLIIDEWSAVPYDLQPFLAEFIKRSFIPIPEVTVKIGALEYRSNFSIPREKHNYVGFEIGSDISSNLDIDEYFVYDRNPETIVHTFSEILFKHINSELEPNYLKITYNITTAQKFIQSVFTGLAAFEELVRASEGVARDFINIFTLAFFDSQRKGQEKIDKKLIVEASRQWFENDKSKNLDDPLHEKLRLIIDEVIGKKRARSFLVPRELEKHGTIQKLFDARVIHIVKKGYSDKDNPGIRYNIYSLDYGTYVDLINTSKQPQIELLPIDIPEAKDSIVPFDDKRSIRRIILSKRILD